MRSSGNFTNCFVGYFKWLQLRILVGHPESSKGPSLATVLSISSKQLPPPRSRNPRSILEMNVKELCNKPKSISNCFEPGADLGGGGGAGRFLLPLRDSAPCRSKGSDLCTILGYPFLVTDHKIFLKAPLVPIYTTNFEGEGKGAPKKRNFWSKFSKSA